MHQARKRFGQHFLQDAAVIDNILTELRPQTTDNIVEIGPGLGALTIPLLRRSVSLKVVELDRDVIPHLQKAAEGIGELQVYQADALGFDFQQCQNAQEKLRLVGNLPYNISTPLLFHLFTQLDCIQDMHFMLQKEVVDRLSAKPGTKAYGRLSVMVQYFCETERLFDVAPDAFRPPPKVMSAVVRLIPLQPKPFVAKDENLLAELVRLAFNQRRKTIANSLKEKVTAEQLSALDIDIKARAENLNVQDYVRLANALTLA
jgi:16S rRNA (adenine1518-N6/adenine1519-N6)-dimethyltransferase